MDDTVKDTIRDIIVDQLGCDADDISEFTDIADDLGADSLDVIEMVMAVEEDFGSNRQKFLAEQGYSYRLVRYTGTESLAALDSPCALPEGGSQSCI